jgi:hypothetical protein
MTNFMKYEIFGVFTAVNIQVEVLWIVAPQSVAVGYQRFEHLAASIYAGDGGIKVVRNDGTRYPTTSLHGVTIHKTST